LFGEYTYDNNGNMISDLNKKINSITYNHLNLPVKIAFPTKAADSRIENAYTAAGIKIKEIVYTAGILTHTTDYSGAFVYKDNWLAYILTPEGRIVIPQPTGNPSGKALTAASYYYEYQLKDHLDNVRVTFTDKDKNGIPEVQSENHYYPFGMPIGALSYTNNVTTHNTIDYKNEYFYNGKEAEDDFGLGWLDYGARMYDPVVGRWWSVDPLVEKNRKWSPYSYCKNDPMNRVDLDGMLDEVYITGNKANEATDQLKKSTSLNITRDDKTGKLTATGVAKTDADKTLLSAIKDKSVVVQVNATSSNYTGEGKWFAGGAFGGSKVNPDGKTYTSQTVNPEQTKKIDNFYGAALGVSVLHEVLESYIGGTDSPGIGAVTGDDVEKNTPTGVGYVNAHNKAQAIDPRHVVPNVSADPTGIYISKFPFDPMLPKSLNPEILINDLK
jgi:RHS repeat-associated protein